MCARDPHLRAHAPERPPPAPPLRGRLIPLLNCAGHACARRVASTRHAPELRLGSRQAPAPRPCPHRGHALRGDRARPAQAAPQGERLHRGRRPHDDPGPQRRAGQKRGRDPGPGRRLTGRSPARCALLAFHRRKPRFRAACASATRRRAFSRAGSTTSLPGRTGGSGIGGFPQGKLAGEHKATGLRGRFRRSRGEGAPYRGEVGRGARESGLPRR